MKLNKLFLGLFGLAALTLASCSDDDKYEWATVSGPQVYFTDNLQTQFEIDPEGTSFNVPISRADASSALTVNLTSTVANPMYSVPASVTFDAGQKEANIPVSYDPSKIEYGRYDSLTIKIADDAQATSWGTQEFTFTAGVTDWGPWQKWNSTGTADYYYSNLFGGDDPDLPFVYRHNMIKPNLYQFKLSNWGYGVDIIFDYDEETGYVTCAKQWTGYENASYGKVWAEDLNAYRADLGYDAVASGYGTFDKEQGIITIPLAYPVYDAGTGECLGSYGYDPEYIYIDGYVRADYSLSMVYAGIFTDVAGMPYAVAQVAAGPDVAEISSVIVEADADASAVADAMVAGDIEPYVTAATEQLYVPIAEDQTGKLQIVSAVIVNGEVKSVAAAPFEYYGGGANPWQSLGTAYYTDDFISGLYGAEPVTYEVQIEENSDSPGLYRMLSPYGAIYPYNEDGDYDTSAPYNIEVNAEDPEGVFIETQATGVDWGDGPMFIQSWGARYLAAYDLETVKANGLLGTVVDGVITLPVLEREASDGSTAYYQGLVYLGDTGYYGCPRGAFKLVLPGASAEVRAKARSAAKASQFARHLNEADKAKHRMTKYIRALQPKE